MSDTNRRILLVDDNQAIHKDFIKILGGGSSNAAPVDDTVADARAAFFGTEEPKTSASTACFELQSAYQGEEAYELVQKSIADEQPYAMAFVDIRMPPGWDGVQTIKKLWEVDSELQVVICTAFADYSWDDMMEELGSSDRLLILKKPFDPVEVCQFATALTEKWNVARAATRRLQEVHEAEQEARSYSASLEILNRALETAKATAEASADAKSTFLANMSHEIRTPMIAILGYTDLLADPSVEKSAHAEYLHTVQTNGRHLLSILDDILDITRIESGNLSIKSAPCSLREITHDVHEMIKLRANEKSLAISVDHTEDCPQSIQSDPTRIRQILLNLASNAVKFTETGSVRISTRLEGNPSAGTAAIHFAVQDTGIGIFPGDQETLFDSFTQADSSSTREYGGTGLGLSISKRLANMLDGDITFTSTHGEGSTFEFVLPLKETLAATDCPTPAIDQDKPENKDSHASPLIGKILVAEDFAPTQRLIAALLRKAGATVNVADNGKDAVDRTNEATDQSEPYDLIIMDMQMPVLDGYRATERIRTMGHAGPIIALTAHSSDSDREKCLRAGCTDYATKPIDRRRLIKLCKSLMAEFAPGAPLPRGEQTPSETQHE